MEMKIGNNYTETVHIKSSYIGTAHMMDMCYSYCNTAERAAYLYNKWCKTIDEMLNDTGFWHSPGTSSVYGPIDGHITDEEFTNIMDKAFEKAIATI